MKRFLRNLVLRNVGFKVVALIVALVLWFGVKADRQTEVRYPVPLEMQPARDDETILTPLPETVDVVFSGTGKELLRLGEQHYRVRKVIEPGPAGPRRVKLDPSNVLESGNLDVRPIAVEPGVLTLTLDRVVSKRVPLRPLGRLEPADGYEVEGEIRFEPPNVTLIGARTILKQIDSLPVDLRRLRGSRGSIPRAISLTIPEYPSVIVQPDSIRILFDVREARGGTASDGLRS